MSAANGRFPETVMDAAMCHVADELGAPAHDARLLRLTNNAVYALPTAGLVIRITRSHRLHDRVHNVVALGAWFADIDAPTIRLATSHPQPLQVDGLLATVWRYLPPTGPDPTVTDLGAVLRTFHQLGTPPFDLPDWDPVEDVRRRLTDAEALRDSDHRFLAAWCDRLEPRIADLIDRTRRQLVHADAHVGNLLRGPGNRLALCDFDATSLGPWQVDLVAVAVGEARFGRHGAHHEFAKSYGYDVTTDPDWRLLREARELKMVGAAVPLLASTPGAAEEFNTRLQSIARNEATTRWTPFAQLRNP